MDVVSVKKTESYEHDVLHQSVSAIFEALEVGKDICPGMKILIKPNLLAGRKPNTAVTAHHELISVIVEKLREYGADTITIADSPSGPYLPASLKSIYSACGYRKPDLEELLNYDVSFRAVSTAQSFSCRSFNIITPVAQADYIINVGKLKTHSMTTMTGAVKNLFGVIPGLQKPEMHYRYPKLEDFVSMLCQLEETVKPDVSILDAVEAMEGNGPGGGNVRRTKILMASRNPFALDSAAAEFIGLTAQGTPHLAAAKRMGLLPESYERIGDELPPADPPFALPDAVKKPDFTNAKMPGFLSTVVTTVASGVLRPYPKVERNKCVGCGKCAESCPQHIITVTNKKASMPRKGCISCFCCQEVCPAHAISVKRLIKL